MIKRTILFTIIASNVVGIAEVQVKFLSVVGKNGEQTSFEKAEVKSINLSPESIDMIVCNSDPQTFKRADIDMILLTNNVSVELVTSSKSRIVVSQSAGPSQSPAPKSTPVGPSVTSPAIRSSPTKCLNTITASTSAALPPPSI